MKKIIIIAICVFAVVTILIVCNLPKSSKKSISSLHINSSVVRLESDMSKRLSITVHPEEADAKGVKLVSENEFVAVCEEDSVVAVNEGETFIYAVSPNGKVKSNKVKVVVSNNIFEVAAKVIMSAIDEQSASKTLSEEVKKSENIVAGEKDKLNKVEVTPKKASQITETEIKNVPQTFELPMLTDENAEDIVYVTKSGTKFHLSSCSSAKNSTPISRSEAVSNGKEPCQKCKP